MENLSPIGRLKFDLRKQFREKARSYGFDAAKSKAICDHIMSIIPKGAKVASFLGKVDEPNLDSLYERTDLQISFPVIEGQNIQFYRPTSKGALKEGPFGLREPIVGMSERTPTDDLDAILVPGIAFDREGVRLGRGKGFYDRALSNYRGLRVGVVTAVQLANECLPKEEHDVPMNLIVTDRFILRIFSQ